MMDVLLPPPPLGIKLTDDRRPAIIIASAITLFLAMLLIILRIVSRRMKNIKLWLDDWLVLAAFPPACFLTFGLSAYAVSRGLGRHVWATPVDSLYALALGLFIAEIGYFFTLMLCKWSILAFYWRTFYIRESIKLPICILAVVVLFWGMAVTLVAIFQCQPVHALWTRFDPVHPAALGSYYCGVGDIEFFYGNAIPTIVTDLLILILPIPYIWSLHNHLKQKLAVTGIFLVGLFVTLISGIRLKYLPRSNLSDPDFTWNGVDGVLWSIVEANVGIVCVCLPFLRPIINKVTCSISRFSSLLYSASRTTNHPASTGEDGGIRVGNGKTHTRTFCHIKSASEGYRSDVELNVLDYHGSIALYAPLGQSYKGPIKLDSVNYGTGSNGIVVQVPAAVYLHRHEPSMPAPGGFSTGRSSISTRLVHVDDGWPLNARQKV